MKGSEVAGVAGMGAGEISAKKGRAKDSSDQRKRRKKLQRSIRLRQWVRKTSWESKEHRRDRKSRTKAPSGTERG